MVIKRIGKNMEEIYTLEDLNAGFYIMPKHKREDYKVSAVKYYLDNEVSYAKTCKIFKCSERSLKRWIDKYLLERSIKRHNRLPVSYKITKEQVKYEINKVKKNEPFFIKDHVNALERKTKLLKSYFLGQKLIVELPEISIDGNCFQGILQVRLSGKKIS